MSEAKRYYPTKRNESEYTMQTHTAVPSPQKSVHTINGFSWKAALSGFFLEEFSHQAPATYYFERLKSLGYVGVPEKEFNRKLDEWVDANIIMKGGPHLYGSKLRAVQPAPVIPRAFQPAPLQVAPPAPVMAPMATLPQASWNQQSIPQPVIPPPAVSFDESVARFMTDLCLRQHAFVVEKLLQSLVQKEANQLVHIKVIGEAMSNFAARNGLFRWKREGGLTGETVGYCTPRVGPPDSSWMRIG